MNLPVFIGVTMVLAGGASWMMGQAMAANWRPVWQVIAYALLLGLADRFIVYALFEGKLLSISGYLMDTAVLIAIALISYRVTQVNTMTKQYPWLYRRAGPFNWHEMR